MWGGTRLLQKRYCVGPEGRLEVVGFQRATNFDAEFIPVENIVQLGLLIDQISADPRKIVIRGVRTCSRERFVRRKSENFPEHEDGTPFVMLDFDNVRVPGEINPLTQQAIDYVIHKLPKEFQGVSYVYQHSNSAGILNTDGKLLKSGLNAHVFFWLSRRVQGRALAAYLKLHCVASGFYEIGLDSGGGVRVRYGIDPSVIVSPVQPHYTAAPDIGPGVGCMLKSEHRQGTNSKEAAEVQIPELPANIIQEADRENRRLADEYKRKHGFKPVYLQTRTDAGFATTRTYVNVNSTARKGRTFVKGALNSTGKFCTLFFDEEASPGSWFAVKGERAHFARHFGGDTMPLRELSEGAYAYVRDVLGWISEVPSHDLPLDPNGYVPPIHSFAKAKVSLILAPTGSGKTKAVIDWIRPKVAGKGLVIYAAPTIALVNQMRQDLAAVDILNRHYKDVGRIADLPTGGVIITTNRSLRRILRLVHGDLVPHNLVVDEIHVGLDEYMKSNMANETFEMAMSKARQTLLLTGTFTNVQRNKMAEVAGHALGGLTEVDFCRYEFASVKRNPVVVRPTENFDSDFIGLLQELQKKLEGGIRLPRVVMLLPSSKLNAFRAALEKHGLLPFAHIVSRPESTPKEIEEARISTLSILIASPLFALGLNFVREPEIYWCSFTHVKADKNQIIQTLNRANRGAVKCDVRVYGNPDPKAHFSLGNIHATRKEVDSRLRSEATLQGALEMHLHVDRTAYLLLRQAEKNSQAALSELVISDEIQNYTVTKEEFVPSSDKGRKEELFAFRAGARVGYAEAIGEQARRFRSGEIYELLWRLNELKKERRDNWLLEDPRLEIEMTQEEQGLIMVLCCLNTPNLVPKIKLQKLFRLFADASPWMSAQYHRESFPDWAKVEAEKTADLALLATVLYSVKAGDMSTLDFSARLTRNKHLKGAFLALSTNDVDFVELGRKFDRLADDRLDARTSGSEETKKKVQAEGLVLLGDLLRPLGIYYPKRPAPGEQERANRWLISTGVRTRMKMVTNWNKLIIPPTWDLLDMAETLLRRSKSLRALPAGQTVPMLDDSGSLGEKPVPLAVCSQCVHLHNFACALGLQVDWQEGASEGDLAVSCAHFKRFKFTTAK
jgi:hypothetical protein